MTLSATLASCREATQKSEGERESCPGHGYGERENVREHSYGASYETSTTTAVMLSLPPRALAKAMNLSTAKCPPSAIMAGISSGLR